MGMKFSIGNGDPIWLQFKYERLPNFCYYCGCLGHVERECMGIDFARWEEKIDTPYGPELRSDTEGRRTVSENQWRNGREMGVRERNSNESQEHSPDQVAKEDNENASDDLANHVNVISNAGEKEKENNLFNGSVTVFSVTSGEAEKVGKNNDSKNLKEGGRVAGKEMSLGPSPMEEVKNSHKPKTWSRLDRVKGQDSGLVEGGNPNEFLPKYPFVGGPKKRSLGLCSSDFTQLVQKRGKEVTVVVRETQFLDSGLNASRVVSDGGNRQIQ